MFSPLFSRIAQLNESLSFPKILFKNMFSLMTFGNKNLIRVTKLQKKSGLDFQSNFQCSIAEYDLSECDGGGGAGGGGGGLPLGLATVRQRGK